MQLGIMGTYPILSRTTGNVHSVGEA